MVTTRFCRDCKHMRLFGGFIPVCDRPQEHDPVSGVVRRRVLFCRKERSEITIATDGHYSCDPGGRYWESMESKST